MGDTRIELVTPTVSTFSEQRWLSWYDQTPLILRLLASATLVTNAGRGPGVAR